MMHLIREVVYQRMQYTPMLACTKVFKAVREFDIAFKVSSYILAAIVSSFQGLKLTGSACLLSLQSLRCHQFWEY